MLRMQKRLSLSGISSWLNVFRTDFKKIGLKNKKLILKSLIM